MTGYELRTRPAGPGLDDSGQWHIVESGGTEGLCHERLLRHGQARPLIDLVDLDPLDRCLPCERTYRGLLTRPLPWARWDGPGSGV